MPQVNVKDAHSLRGSRSHWQQVMDAAAKEQQHAKALIARRNRQLAALKAHEPGAHTGLLWALDQVAHKVEESPPGSNRGPQVDAWNEASGVAPGRYAYWCQSFANAVVWHGGGAQIHSGYTPAVVEWAREGKHGLKLIGSSYAAARPGDFVYFKFPGVSHDFCDHVGVRTASTKPQTVEGNTSPGLGGSQNNGGVVALHGAERIPYTVAVVRPTYRR